MDRLGGEEMFAFKVVLFVPWEMVPLCLEGGGL